MRLVVLLLVSLSVLGGQKGVLLAGGKIWEFKTGADVSSSPCISGGRVYVGSCDGRVYCISAGVPEAGGWTMFGGGPEHGGYNRCEE